MNKRPKKKVVTKSGGGSNTGSILQTLLGSGLIGTLFNSMSSKNKKAKKVTKYKY